MIEICIISAGLLFPLYKSLIHLFRAAHTLQRRAILLGFVAVHLSTWVGAQISESRRLSEERWGEYQRAVKHDRDRAKDAEAVLGNAQATVWEREVAEVTLKTIPSHLYKSPSMHCFCVSPFPFVFVCYQDSRFGPLYGSGNSYIGVYTWRRMIRLYEFGGWIS